jgi:hypothetical protein
MLVALACKFWGITPEGETVPVGRGSSVQNVKAEVGEAGIVHVAIKYWRGPEEQVTLVCSYPGEDGVSTL